MVEAWSELRIHKTRVLLALNGVALSAAVLTTVVDVGNLAREAMRLDFERNSGREATLSVSIHVDPTMAQAPVAERTAKVLAAVVERYGFTHASRVTQAQGSFQFPNGVQGVQLTVVDPQYGDIHRVDVAQGTWFAVGVMVAVAAVKNPFVESKVAPGLDIYPAFPVEAALPGLGSAVLVGALAGAIPALVAIRVKVIDAIRV